ncbi:MAG: peroxiredoxin [Candidatus Micrarchaeota archaeon]|nr:peroxiredoxin [Candidatus Micrarchaeota archaeon]
MVEVGSKAPAFSLKDSSGKVHKLADYKGKKLVVYFYPKDDTPGCTIEAKDFTALLPEIRKAGADVVGISKDSEQSHCDFEEKYKLKVTLLADPDNKTIKAYDAYGDKGIFGMGTIRKTYIIDESGKILKVYPRVQAIGHAKAVLEEIRGV